VPLFMDSIEKAALLAPMAGISNLPFRIIARSFGCALAFTEMVSANGLIRDSQRTLDYLRSSDEDKPLGVQIFGADPYIMAHAAKIAADYGADLIDINMGCPVRKVIKTGSGAALMRNPALAGRIISSVVQAVTVPVTVKIRAGWSRNSINAVEMAQIAENAGAQAVTVHARTADQGFSGNADWNVIADVKKSVSIKVIGNGDIFRPHDAIRMLMETSCDEVMLGRGALGNPWIFKWIIKLKTGNTDECLPPPEEILKMIKYQWQKEKELSGAKSAAKNFRKHMLWYTRGLENSACFRKRAGMCSDEKSLMNELNKYFEYLIESNPFEYGIK